MVVRNDMDRATIDIGAGEAEIYRVRAQKLLPQPARRPKLIDLYSGAGGMTLGFTQRFGHWFEPVWANDVSIAAVGTYNANFGNHCNAGNIVEVLQSRETEIPQADVVIGGPPCQGFSPLNKNRDGDPRRHLWKPFLEVVRRCGAEIWVMENVPQLLGST